MHTAGSPAKKKAKAKKKKKHPKCSGENGHYYSGMMADTEIKHDIPEMVVSLLGSDPDDLLPPLGFPKGVMFDDDTIKDNKAKGTFPSDKEKPDWCFLQIDSNISKKTGLPLASRRKTFCISMNGTSISTKLLSRKRQQGMTLTVMGKDMIMTVHDSTIEKLAALLACSPKVNGNGTIQEQ